MKNLNRWIFAVFGVMMLLGAGLVYAWSIFKSSISEEFPDWTNAQLSLAFTLIMTFFCLGGLISGLINKKVNIRIRIIFAAILFLVGFTITAHTETLMGLYLGFGVIAGLGSGFVYNGVMSTVIKWFPDKQGLISGVLLMGFGFGSFIIGKVFAAYTPSEIGGWRTSFQVIGIVLCIVTLIGMIFMESPGADYKVETKTPSAKEKKSFVEGIDVNSGAMMKRPTFWLYYVWAILVSAAGLALVSQASGIVVEVDSVITSGGVATLVGIISIVNGLGRVAIGAIYDKKGHKAPMLIDMGLYIICAACVIIALLSGSVVLLVAGFLAGGFAYGGATTINSAFISAFYGPTHYATNFPIVATNLIFASFSSTIAGNLVDASGSYVSTMIMVIVLAVGAFVSFLGIKRP